MTAPPPPWPAFSKDLYDKDEVPMYVVLKPEVVAAKTRPINVQ